MLLWSQRSTRSFALATLKLRALRFVEVSLRNRRHCLIPAHWTREDLALHSCRDGSHAHLSSAEVHDARVHALVEWVLEPVRNRDRGIVRLCRQISARGLSCRVGELLALAVSKREHWARLMIADIRMNSRFAE